MPCHLPYDNAGRDRDIERVFRAVLRYLKASVAHVYDLLLHAMHLIAEDNSMAMLSPFGGEEGLGEKRRALTLLDSKHREALVVKTTDSITCVLEILPLDALLCSERRLVNLILRRDSRYAAQHYASRAESITRTEDRPDIVHRADIIKNDDKRHLLSHAEFLCRETLHF